MNGWDCSIRSKGADRIATSDEQTRSTKIYSRDCLFILFTMWMNLLNFLSTPWNFCRISSLWDMVYRLGIRWVSGYHIRFSGEYLMNQRLRWKQWNPSESDGGIYSGSFAAMYTLCGLLILHSPRFLSLAPGSALACSSLAHCWFFYGLAALHLSLQFPLRCLIAFATFVICFVPLLARGGALDRLFDGIVRLIGLSVV
jgi:hypothetical protein